MKIPKYIDKLSETEGIFSVVTFHDFRTDVFKFLQEKKFERVYEKSHIHIDGNAKWGEIIYKTKQPFYLFLENNSDDTVIWNLTIFYKPEQFNELVFFIGQVLRQLRDESLDN
jgi:type IV secretory pathway VirB9-like protein